MLILFGLGQLAWAGPASAEPADPRRQLAAAVGLIALVLLAPLVKAATVALALCAAELAPRSFREGRAVFTASPVKSFFVGLVNLVLAVVVALALIAMKITAILGLLLLVVLLLALFSSRALVYQLLGTRLVGEVSDPEAPPSVRAHCWGGVAIELAFLMPVLGQIVAAIVTTMTFGALVLAAMTRQQSAASGK